MRTVLLPILNWLVLLALAYAWLWNGVEGAGNLVTAFCWLVGVVGLLMIFITPTKPRDPRAGPLARGVVAWCFWLLALALVWFDHTGLAALLVLGAAGRHIHGEHFNADGTLKAKG